MRRRSVALWATDFSRPGRESLVRRSGVGHASLSDVSYLPAHNFFVFAEWKART
jgi:hypothetical protein